MMSPMKKLLGILVLGLLLSGNAYALTQQYVIDNYLKGRKLEKIEGVWVYQPGGRIIVIYKKDGSFYSKVIKSAQVESGTDQHFNLSKGSSNYYYGNTPCAYTDNSGWSPKTRWTTCTTSIMITGPNTMKENHNFPSELRITNTPTNTAYRLWPENFKNHNAKYEKKKEKEEAKIKASSGTAFFVTTKGHLITNHHVIKGCKDKSKIIFKDKEYPVKLIAKDKVLDFALLKVDLRSTPYIALSNKPPKKLQRIVVAGYPLGKSLSDDLKFTSGIISSLKGINDDSTLIQIDAALNPGNSGGPIVDDSSGELIAVAVSGLRKDMTEAVNFGIKTNSLKNFLDSNQIESETSKLLFSFGSVDVSEILENATVYTFCK